MATAVELWRPVDGYAGLYEVSSLGRVRSLSHWTPHWAGGIRWHKGKLLKQARNGDYRYVYLSKEGVRTFIAVHRMVATAFLPNPNRLPQINHKDHRGHNNKASNLEWSTALHNLHHARNHYVFDAMSVRAVREMHGSGALRCDIAALMGVHVTTISKIVACTRWQHID